MNTTTGKKTIRLKLTDMAYGGDAVGRDPESGMAVFARGGITGEDVEVTITGGGKNMMRGVVTAVHETSPHRIEPPYLDFVAWGGVPWQHIAYEAQVAFKHDILRSQLSRLGGITDPDAVLLAAIPSPAEFHYRNTSHFSLDPSVRSLAYHRQGSHALIPVETCPVSNEGINELMPFVNNTLRESAAEIALIAGHEGRGIMRVWKISIRSSAATGHSVIIFHSLAGGRAEAKPGRYGRQTRREASPSQDVASTVDDDPSNTNLVTITRRAVRKAIPTLTAQSAGDTPPAVLAVEVMDDGTINRLGETRGAGSVSSEAIAEILTGASLRAPKESSEDQRRTPLGAWIERLGDRMYWVGPESFFQTSTNAAELLVSEVARHVPGKLNLIVDAHAGVGTFALQFATRAKRVLAFETETNSVESGVWSAYIANVKNVEFRKGRAEDLLVHLSPNDKPDVIILDPPRAGCHPALLKEIARRRVPRLVYVSCDPSTLARDIKLLASTYKLSSARVVDMFPQTYHIETVAVFDVLPEAVSESADSAAE
jgi:tRNA/tmRNA/rRNA uracil-C5-methylase (TrmA/RlmC/RlmD family)